MNAFFLPQIVLGQFGQILETVGANLGAAAAAAPRKPQPHLCSSLELPAIRLTTPKNQMNSVTAEDC